MTRWFIQLSATVAVLLVAVLIAGATSPGARGAGPNAPLIVQAQPAALTVKTVNVGSEPSAELYDPANHDVYVGNVGSNTVSAINSTTYAVTTISAGKNPEILTYSASNKDVYVENSELKTVTVISSANKVIHTLTLPGTVFTQTYDPANGDVYVESLTSTDIWEFTDINHASFALKNVVMPSEALYAVYDNASTSLVLTLPGLNEVFAVSATDVGTTVKLTTGVSPEWMVYNPNDKDLYITDVGSSTSKTGNVSVLSSANKIIATIKVGKFPTFAAYDPSNHDIYEVNTVGATKPYPTGSVSVIGTSNKVLTTIALGKYAVVATYDPKNSEMYISCAGSNLTYAIDSATNAVVAKIATTQNAIGTVYDAALGDSIAIGLTNFGGGSSTAKTIVTVIPSSNTGTSKLTLGIGPATGLAYDPTDSGLWVVNEGAKTVSVIL